MVQSKILFIIIVLCILVIVAVVFFNNGARRGGTPGKSTSTLTTTIRQTSSISTTTMSPTTTIQFNATRSDSQFFETKYESVHCKAYFNSVDQHAANIIIQACEYIYPHDVELYGGNLPNKTAVYIFHSLKDVNGLMSAFPLASPNSSGGGFDTFPPLGDGVKTFNPISEGYLNKSIATVWMRGFMAHEVGHRFFYYLYPNLRKPVRPNWLDEGIAMYAEYGVGGNTDYGFGVARENISMNGPVPLNTLDKLQGSSNTLELFYGEASTVINYMVSRVGEDGLRRFLNRYNQTANLNDSFLKTFGVNETMFDRQYANCTKKIASETNNGTSFYYLLKKGC